MSASRRVHPPFEGIEARPWRRSSPPERILAIRLQAMGDTVLTLPYLSALRRAIPGAELDFLTRREVADIPEAVVLFDSVHALGGGRSRWGIMLHALALLPRLQARRYDVVLDLQRNPVSRMVRRALRPEAWTEFDRYSPRLAGERTRSTIERAGLGPLEVRPGLELERADLGVEKLVEAGWDGAAALVVLNPAGAFGGRAWPLESYARFAELWTRQVAPNTGFLLLGLPSMAERAAALRERLGSRLIDLVGRTTAAEAFAILGRATLVLSEDSGLMHMAWVAGVPTLALFGASYATWSRPHGDHTDCLQACRRVDGDCIGGVCLEDPPTCLEEVSAETVVERARRLLNAHG